eukprot:CAMPEP_0171377002 /NCGR_PEP_ID=MMETSP0879-20121228/19943_1 /TAXON_ID=67004 /ORGANISM="Thalassiosira weissflogii, Strain CCMP1336" /LENGTH=619 /DNA_ID=CAMNT_0011887017 /DNA_START=208 /DNA_END=2067 /DNA_ORIENTATION=-
MHNSTPKPRDQKPGSHASLASNQSARTDGSSISINLEGAKTDTGTMKQKNLSFRPTFISPRKSHHRSSRHPSQLIRRSTALSQESSRSQYQDSRQELEECISTIESILTSSPPSHNNLSRDQTSAVQNLREKINKSCHQQSFPPSGDYSEYDGSSAAQLVPSCVMEDLENPNHRFIATLYGGLKIPEVRTKVRSPLIHNIDFLGNGKNSTKHYVPEEWAALSRENQLRLAELLSLSNLKRWDFNILNVIECLNDTPRNKETDDFTTVTTDGTSAANPRDSNILVIVGWAIIASPESQRVMAISIGRQEEFETTLSESDGYNFGSTESGLSISYATLVYFLRAVEAEYISDNRYHNSIHAADVLQTLHSLIQMGRGGISEALKKIDEYSMLLSAVAHDIGHPGTNNLYQINAKTDLAIIYNDKSCLENMHAAKTFQLIFNSGKSTVCNINVLESLSPQQSNQIRNAMIQAILATDMSHHFSSVSYIENIAEQFDDEDMRWSDLERTDDNIDIVKTITNYMIHLADISNPCKSLDVAKYWADCALSEFFAQGDLEAEKGLPISPLCDRNSTDLASSQRDFIRYIVLPAFEVLGSIILDVETVVVPQIVQNLEYWENISDDK